MYIPPFNRINDRHRIVQFIKSHGFASVVSAGQSGIGANHLPVLWDEKEGSEWGMLRSHMARADETALRQIVYDTTAKYESGRPDPWTIPLSEKETQKMLKAIVGFTIDIKRVEAKFKLGQNRSAEDQAGMLSALQKSADSGSVELARFIMEQSAPSL